MACERSCCSSTAPNRSAAEAKNSTWRSLDELPQVAEVDVEDAAEAVAATAPRREARRAPRRCPATRSSSTVPRRPRAGPTARTGGSPSPRAPRCGCTSSRSIVVRARPPPRPLTASTAPSELVRSKQAPVGAEHVDDRVQAVVHGAVALEDAEQAIEQVRAWCATWPPRRGSAGGRAARRTSGDELTRAAGGPLSWPREP